MRKILQRHRGSMVRIAAQAEANAMYVTDVLRGRRGSASARARRILDAALAEALALLEQERAEQGTAA